MLGVKLVRAFFLPPYFQCKFCCHFPGARCSTCNIGGPLVQQDEHGMLELYVCADDRKCYCRQHFSAYYGRDEWPFHVKRRYIRLHIELEAADHEL